MKSPIAGILNMPLMNRRHFALATSAALAWPTQAQFRVEISGVGATQRPIAVAKFRDEDKTPHVVSSIVRADLERCGVFKGVDADIILDENTTPSMSEWRSRLADLVVGGSVTRLADERFEVRAKVWDVIKGQELGGQSLVVPPADLRLAAHRIADFIFELITGEKGVFSTRIAYVTRSAKTFTLRVADADGEGGQVALNSPEPIISPAWAPNARELAYVSFERQKAVVFAQDLATGQRREVANFRGSNSAPAWSPDSQSLAVTLSRDGLSQIYMIGRNGDNPKRLTNSQGIDTEPVFSPDGQSVYFVSDRGGSPQIYRTSVSGGSAERVSFTGNYNISPSISPDGRHLAYISRQSGAFKLYLAELGASSSARALTDTAEDESPSFAPNGRLIMYCTRLQGRDVLMTTTLDGKIKTRLVSAVAEVREPMWGPFGR
jgi:TolB protein